MIRRPSMRRWLISTTALAGVLALGAPAALANPEGGTVMQGAATITQPDAKTVQVNQTSDKAVIDWRSFSIAPGELTRFVQPSTSASVLNRVTGDQVSQILGSLQANGRVYLVNPNGIVFGAGSKIDVGALIASTANIKTENFMAGNMKFDIPGNPGAQIINQGTITAADGGLVALVSPSLRNSGIIVARLGKVGLAAANGATLDLYGDNLILFQASDKITSQVVGLDGKPVTSLIENDGKIYADGGRVLLTANTAKGVVDNAINTTGLISARAVEQQGGEIVLKGEYAGIVQVSGTLDASGKETGQKGGSVQVLGEKVGLVGNASVDVSGDAGGGTALVGGDYQGKGTVRNAQVTTMGQDATINASALRIGNGGKAILWADGTTRSYGRIFAQGGINGGDGGFVETSGKGFLDQTGTVNTLALKGKTGTWLLDPMDIYVANNGGQTLDGTNSSLFVDNSGATSIIAPSVINSATSNVTLQASRDAYVINAINMTNAGKALIIEAGRDLRVNANINTNNGDIFLLGGYSSATGQGGVNAGAIDVNGATIASGSGQIVITGKGSANIVAPFWGYGQIGVLMRNGATVQSQSGNITVSGAGVGGYGLGVLLTGGSTITSENGDVKVTGVGGAGSGDSFGVALYDTGSAVDKISVTGSGGLRVEGTGQDATWSYGVWVGSGKISHTGTLGAGKKYEVIGHGAHAGHMSYGVNVSGNGQISTVDAPLVVSGDAGNADAYDSFGIGAANQDVAYFLSTGSGSISLYGTPGASAGSRRYGIAFGGNTYNGEEPGYIQSSGGDVILSADSFYIRNTTTYGALVRGAGSASQVAYNSALAPTNTTATPPTPPAPGSNGGTSSGTNGGTTNYTSSNVLNGQPGQSGTSNTGAGTTNGGTQGHTSPETLPVTSKSVIIGLMGEFALDKLKGTAANAFSDGIFAGNMLSFFSSVSSLQGNRLSTFGGMLLDNFKEANNWKGSAIDFAMFAYNKSMEAIIDSSYSEGSIGSTMMKYTLAQQSAFIKVLYAEKIGGPTAALYTAIAEEGLISSTQFASAMKAHSENSYSSQQAFMSATNLIDVSARILASNAAKVASGASSQESISATESMALSNIEQVKGQLFGGELKSYCTFNCVPSEMGQIVNKIVLARVQFDLIDVASDKKSAADIAINTLRDAENLAISANLKIGISSTSGQDIGHLKLAHEIMMGVGISPSLINL